MTDGDLRELMSRVRRVAVVGASARTERDSHRVFRYLRSVGWSCVPVNPREPEVDGVPAVPSLREAGPIDVVDVFRRSEAVPEIVDEVLELGLPVLWLQPGAENAEAAARAAAAGVVVVSGRCLMAEHRRLLS